MLTEPNGTYRATMRSEAFQWAAATGYRTVQLACCKRRVSSEQKGIRRLDQSIQHRGLVSPRPSFRTLACTGRPSGDMDERWAHICSSAFSAKQGDMMGQVQDDCPPSNLELGSAYPGGLSEKEIERRRKISAANKGKAPWTKGRKLTQGMSATLLTRIFYLGETVVHDNVVHKQYMP